MLRTIIWGLIATIHKREADSFAEWVQLTGQVHQLKEQLQKEYQLSVDKNTPLEGFKLNNEHWALDARISDGKGAYIMPKWVRFMETGEVMCYAADAPKDSFPYVCKVFTQPSLNNNKPFTPMPNWFQCLLHADKGQWQTMYQEVTKIGSCIYAWMLNVIEGLHVQFVTSPWKSTS